jgi:hypothetical protein
MKLSHVDYSRFGGNFIHYVAERKDLQVIPLSERQSFEYEGFKVNPVSAFLWRVPDMGDYTTPKLAVVAIKNHLQKKEDTKNARKKTVSEYAF